MQPKCISNTAYPSNSQQEVVLQIIDCFSRLEPLFEQVLIVGVAPCPQGDGGLLPELAGVGVDEDGHQPGRALRVRRGSVLDLIVNFI